MALLETLIGPIASLIDKIIPDKEARARAKLELLQLEGTQEMKLIEARLQAIVAEANSSDPWTSRARPSRSEEHTSELQSLMRISSAVFCLKKNTKHYTPSTTNHNTIKHT